MAYRISSEGYLLTAALPPTLRGGLMLLSDRDAGPPQESLATQVLQECLIRNYAGVVLDSDGPPTLPAQFPSKLEALLLQHRRKLFLPEHYASAAPQSTVLICTAISGGHLRQYLQEAQERYTSIALDLQRLQMDFSLPSPEGRGIPLSDKQLQHLCSGHPVFFSQPLCARYFTYTRATQPHLVLFDDSSTLKEKIRLGRELGISWGFFMLPETTDLLDDLFPLAEEDKRT